MKAEFSRKANGLTITNGRVTLLSLPYAQFEETVTSTLEARLVSVWGTLETFFKCDQALDFSDWSALNQAIRKLVKSKLQRNPRDWPKEVIAELDGHTKKGTINNAMVKTIADEVVAGIQAQFTTFSNDKRAAKARRTAEAA